MNKLVLILFAVFNSCILAFAQVDTGSAKHNTSVENNSDLNINVSLYPNPSSDFINIQIEDNSISAFEFKMYDIIGGQVTIKPEKIESNKYRIPVKNLKNGYYYLSVYSKELNTKKAFKFLKV